MMNNLRIPRAQYLDQLIAFRDKPVIKAIVGIRRCGKSTLLEMYRDYLVSSGVPQSQIVTMNFSHAPFSELPAAEIGTEVKKHAGRTYLLLDEVQMLEAWDRLVLDLFENCDCDICLTGSNSVMFSSQLSTLLSGRAVTIEMFPFSYREFLRYTGEPDSDRSLTEYLTYGGFPLALMVRASPEAESAIIEDIYSTVVLKDIVLRHKLRNKVLLDRISRFLIRNIGSLVSVKSIQDYMQSNGLKVNFETVDDYLGYLEESLAFYRVKRYNVRAKEELVVNDKFYLADPGIRTAVLGRREADLGHLMENLVYLELRRRGFAVYVGVAGDSEIDFVAIDGSHKVYLQVCYSLEDPATAERELRPLIKCGDSYRKLIVVMRPSLNRDNNGIEELPLRDLLNGAAL